MEFIKFTAVIVAVLSPVVLIFVTPEIFPYLLTLWLVFLGISAAVILILLGK